MKYDPMSARHREDLALALCGKATECGFEPVALDRTREAVYAREVHGTEGRVRVLVYTSAIREGNGSIQVRMKDWDAIRVCAVYRNNAGEERGIYKADARVYRVGQLEEIPERLYQRMREVYGKALSPERCHCGAPKFKSKKGKGYCAELCWKS